MLNKIYLKGLSIDPTDASWPQEIVPISPTYGITRYICTQDDGKKYKQYIFDLLKKYGQPELRETWEFHHIVERRHYADINFNGDLEELYKKVLPCVLIAEEEHDTMTTILKLKESSELWRDKSLPKQYGVRAKYVKREAKNRKNYKMLKVRIQKLEQLYMHTYTYDTVLKQIAKNVFTEARNNLFPEETRGNLN